MLARITFFILALCALSTFGQNECSEDQITTYENNLDGRIKDIVFASYDRQDVYVKTDNAIYHSTDGGNYFYPIMDNMTGYYDTLGTSQNGVYKMIPGAVDGLVYFIGANRRIFWSTRGSDLYKDHPTENNDVILSLAPHPTNQFLLLREMVVTQNGSYVTQLDVNLAQGFDSWSTVRQYIYSYSWVDSGNRTIFVSVPEENMEGNYGNTRLQDRRLYSTDDFGESYSHVSEGGLFDFLYSEADGTLYAAKYDEETGRSDLYISTQDRRNENSEDPYLPAQFRGMNSVAHVDSNEFIILDSEEISFITVCGDGESMTGNLYQANLDDALFWLDRPNIRGTCSKTHYRGVDFQEIYSMPGTYFSNGYAAVAMNGSVENIDDYVQSTFSFNKGGTWTLLNAAECQGESDCFLNVFGVADGETQDIYSRADAVGLVIATGNVGEFRGPLEDSNTYLSRNGGFTWELLKSGRHLYILSPNGNLIVLVSQSETNEMFFTWDQGITWNSCIFSETPLSIELIVDLTPSGSNRFLLVGLGEQNNGTIISVDFDDFEISECQGFNTPGTADSNYEYFQPTVEGACLLGKQTQYTRRKQDSACLSLNAEVEFFEGACNCTRLDFTCDGDCWKEDIDETGALICANNCVGLENDPTAPPEDCQGTYLRPSGYKKVVGDVCIGGTDYAAPVSEQCPDSNSPTPVTPPASPNPIPSATPSATPIGNVVSPPPPSNNGTGTNETETGLGIGMIIGGIVLAVILLFIILVLIVLALYKLNPKFRRMVNTYLPASMGGGSGDTKLYSVLGDSDEVNSLFAEDDMFVDDNSNVPVSTDNTPLGSLLDFDDEDAEGAIDIQL